MPLLASLGHDIVISTFYGLQGSPMVWNGFTVLPASQHLYGSDVLNARVKREEADLLITLMDAWALEALPLVELKVAQWMPVDCEPLGMLDRDALRISGAQPIAMSRFGEAQLREAGFDPLYVPHAIDTSVFAPSPDREAARKANGLGGGVFVVGINAVNKDPYRKAMDAQIFAFARLHEKYPDTRLLVHSLMKDGIVSLRPLLENVGLADGSVIFSDQYAYIHGVIEQDSLAIWYSCLDLFSGCAMGEGFGLPILEAQSCGVPVVVTDASSMSELCGAGWKVRGQRWWNWNQEARWSLPLEDQIFRAYEQAYKRGPAYQKKQKAAREFALQFDAKRVLADYWAPALAALEKGRPVRAAGLSWKVETLADRMGPYHEESVEQALLALITEGCVFLDVGAHVGHYSLRASQVASKVIAVEANSAAAQRLHENIALNGIVNITVHEVAAWDSRCKLALYSPNGTARDGSMRIRDDRESQENHGAALGVPLDAILAGEEHIDVVKLDVEGADLHALRGMTGLIGRHQPVMFIEDHSIYGYYDRADLEALLTELGYSWADGGSYGGAAYLMCRPRKVRAG